MKPSLLPDVADGTLGGSHTPGSTWRADSKKPDGSLKRPGPGLITGAADNEPYGIGTYRQAGALRRRDVPGKLMVEGWLYWLGGRHGGDGFLHRRHGGQHANVRIVLESKEEWWTTRCAF
jgi:hypothetical protein